MMNWTIVWITAAVLGICFLLALAPWGKIIQNTNVSAISANKDKYKMLMGAAAIIIVAALIWWFWSDIAGISIFKKLILAAIIAFIGWKFLKGMLGTLVLTGGVAAFLAVLLFSNYGKKAEEYVVSAEKGAASAGLWGCPDEHQVEAGDTFELTSACPEVDIRLPYGQDLRFHISDSRFNGYYNDWVSSPWDEKDANLQHHTMNKWPKEGDPKATVRVVTPEQAAKIDTIADTAAVKRAISGATE